MNNTVIKRSSLFLAYAKAKNEEGKTIVYREDDLENYRLFERDVFYPIGKDEETGMFYYIVKPMYE